MAMPKQRWEADARAAFDAALAAGHPARVTAEALANLDRPATALIAIGKAATAMARAARDSGGLLPDCPGIIVTNDENFELVEGFDCYASAHPVPDQRGVDAALAVAALAGRLGPADHLLLLVSGGGSALLPAPADGISLADKIRLNEALLASGMDIHQMNAVRRLFSSLKGGRLARLAFPARITQLLLSDVPGDRLESIASGPAVADPVPLTTALALITNHHLDRLDFVARHIAAITAGEADEPVRPEASVLAGVASQILASNSVCQQVSSAYLEARAGAAIDGLLPLDGDAVACGAALAQRVIAESQEQGPGTMFHGVSGGETTVVLGQGPVGKGGRSQELALSFACEIRKAADAPRDWLILAGGTDGRDGPTDAAGAIITSDGDFDEAAAVAALAGHDVYHYLQARDQLLKVPPTGTNLGDLVFVMAAK